MYRIKTVLGMFLLCAGIIGCANNYRDNNHLNAHSDKRLKPTFTKTVNKPKKKTYTVFGKSYQVLRSSKDYHEKGIASWYGRQFHQKYTSSGERYNMYKLTAAHKTLPLPTYVMVTNLKNNRKVVVKVNDRGPFVGTRLIDLSYAAAKELGMVGRGIAPVSIKAISRA